MLRKAKARIGCHLGQHGETYLDPLVVTDIEVKRCKTCNAIPDSWEAQIAELEIQTMQDLHDINPLRARHQRVREVVLAAWNSHQLPVRDSV